jgi:hypothetical protein
MASSQCPHPATTGLGAASPCHPRITRPSPIGQTLPDQEALTCNSMPAPDRHRRPWTVSTTCARWCPARGPGSGPQPLPARHSGIAGWSVVSHSRPRPSHVSQNPTRPGEADGSMHPRIDPSGTADVLVDRVGALRRVRAPLRQWSPGRTPARSARPRAASSIGLLLRTAERGSRRSLVSHL